MWIGYDQISGQHIRYPIDYWKVMCRKTGYNLHLFILRNAASTMQLSIQSRHRYQLKRQSFWASCMTVLNVLFRRNLKILVPVYQWVDQVTTWSVSVEKSTVPLTNLHKQNLIVSQRFLFAQFFFTIHDGLNWACTIGRSSRNCWDESKFRLRKFVNGTVVFSTDTD